MRAAPSIESAVTYIFKKPAGDEDPAIDDDNANNSGTTDNHNEHGSDERPGKRLKKSNNGSSATQGSRRSAKKRTKSHLPEFKVTAVRPTATPHSADGTGDASNDEPEVDIFAEWVAATSGKITTPVTSTSARTKADSQPGTADAAPEDDSDNDGDDSEDEFLAELILLRRSKVTKNT